MIYFLFGLLIYFAGLWARDKWKDSKLYLIPLAISILFVSIDFYYAYQGELIDKFYNGGAGIVFRRHVLNETDNSTYSVDVQLFSYEDTKVGDYIGYIKGENEAMKIVGLVLKFLIVGSILFIVYVGLKHLKLIR